MTDSLLSLFAPMLLGAQLVLTLVLVKGEICPGQRGRVHKLLPAIGVLWLALSMVHISAFAVGGVIFYFFSQVQTKKTRERGPLWALGLSDLFAAVFVFFQFIQLGSVSASLSWVLLVLVLGASFANLLLLIARSRLEAFHKLLPVTGIVSGILLSLTIAMQAYGLSNDTLVDLQVNILAGMLLLLSGLLIWPLHMITGRAVSKLQLSCSLGALFVSSLSLYPLLQLV